VTDEGSSKRRKIPLVKPMRFEHPEYLEMKQDLRALEKPYVKVRLAKQEEEDAWDEYKDGKWQALTEQLSEKEMDEEAIKAWKKKNRKKRWREDGEGNIYVPNKGSEGVWQKAKKRAEERKKKAIEKIGGQTDEAWLKENKAPFKKALRAAVEKVFKDNQDNFKKDGRKDTLPYPLSAGYDTAEEWLTRYKDDIEKYWWGWLRSGH
jgi:hypothetical protein